MGCEQARKRKLGGRGRRGWAGRKPVGSCSPGWALVPASCPTSVPSIKPSADISTICSAPAPSNLPKCAPVLTLVASFRPLLPLSDGWLLPWARLPTAGETWAGREGQTRGSQSDLVTEAKVPCVPRAAGDARDKEIRVELRQGARR